MLPPRLAGGGAAGFVDGLGSRGTVAEKFFELEELLRDGGDVAPGGEALRRHLMSEAKTAVGGDAGELPREKFTGEFVPFRVVDGSQQLPGPSAAACGLGEIT